MKGSFLSGFSYFIRICDQMGGDLFKIPKPSKITDADKIVIRILRFVQVGFVQKPILNKEVVSI